MNFLLLALSLVARHVHADGGVVAVDDSGDLSVTPLLGRAVFVQGVDVMARVAAANGQLRALAATLGIVANLTSTPPADPTVTGKGPWVGLDPQGNLLLVPASSIIF